MTYGRSFAIQQQLDEIEVAENNIDPNCRWSTPEHIFDPLNDEFGFDLDVCAERWNHKCEKYFSPVQDGLAQDWSGTAWMNPPYGREIDKWIRKAHAESKKGTTVVCLIPARTDTAWWHDCCLDGEIRFVRGRIHFTDYNGKSGRPRFGSAIVIFRGGTAARKPRLLRPESV